MAEGLQPRGQNIANSLLGAISSPAAIPEMPVNIAQLQTPIIDEARRLTQPMQSLGAPSTGNFLNTDAINADVFSGAEQLARSTSPVFEMPPRPDLTEKKSGGLLSGLKNLVSDPAAMAQMAIAFNSMRLRPDQGLAQSMQNVIERQGLIRSGNATAQALRKVGTELALKYADAIENNPSESADLYKAYLQEVNKGKDTPSKVQEYEYAVSQGYPGRYIDFLNLTKEDGPSFSVTTGPSYPPAPAGFYYTEDEDGKLRLETIPGGPAEQKQQERVEQKESQETMEENQASIISREVKRLVDLIDKGGFFNLPEAGIWGSRLAKWGINQEAVDFQTGLEAIQSIISFERLQQMRDASKTGGALGNVSERELDLLIASYGSLNQSSSPKILRENVLTIEEIMNKILEDDVARAFYYSEEPTSSNQSGQGDGFEIVGKVE